MALWKTYVSNKKAGDMSVDTPSCNGPVGSNQHLVIWNNADPSRKITEIGRVLNTLCRELPFDDTATCQEQLSCY
jgi:hypothetical protein